MRLDFVEPIAFKCVCVAKENVAVVLLMIIAAVVEEPVIMLAKKEAKL